MLGVGRASRRGRPDLHDLVRSQGASVSVEQAAEGGLTAKRNPMAQVVRVSVEQAAEGGLTSGDPERRRLSRCRSSKPPRAA